MLQANRFDPSMRIAAVLLGVGIVLTAGCEKKKEVVAPPPPDVDVVQVVQRNVPIIKEWVATLNGSRQRSGPRPGVRLSDEAVVCQRRLRHQGHASVPDRPAGRSRRPSIRRRPTSNRLKENCSKLRRRCSRRRRDRARRSSMSTGTHRWPRKAPSASRNSTMPSKRIWRRKRRSRRPTRHRCGKGADRRISRGSGVRPVKSGLHLDPLPHRRGGRHQQCPDRRSGWTAERAVDDGLHCQPDPGIFSPSEQEYLIRHPGHRPKQD